MMNMPMLYLCSGGINMEMDDITGIDDVGSRYKRKGFVWMWMFTNNRAILLETV